MTPKILAIAVLVALTELRTGAQKQWRVFIDPRHGLVLG